MSKTNLPSKDKTHLKGTTFLERHPIIPGCISVANAMNILAFNKNKAVIDSDNLEVYGKEVEKDSLIMSKTLIQLGIKPGDIITCQMPNLYQAFLVFHAANTIGAIVSYISAFATKEETAEYLNKYNSKLLFNMESSKEETDFLLQQSPVKHIISLGKDKINNRDFYDLSSDMGTGAVISYNSIGLLADKQRGHFKKWFGGNQEALILHTSGSTGNPKSMLFTNQNILAALIYLKCSSRTGKTHPGDTKWMNVVPFMYPYGFVVSVLGTLLSGREVILTPEVNLSTVSKSLKKNPNIIYGSPAYLEMIKRGLPQDQKCSSLHTFVSGGDFLSVQKSEEGTQFFKDHGANVLIANGSGNGEILGCCTNAMGMDYRPDTVGKLVVGPKYKIINPETGKEVHYNEQGVICVRGKHLFQGYYGNEEETKKSMIEIDGKKYYNTGNIGKLDEDRYFEMIGRASRFYIVGTLNKVYCEGVQKRISLMPMVDSCVVVPKPNDENLYEGKAYVKLKENFTPSKETAEYIIANCYVPYIEESTGEEISLKEYEIPASVSFVAEIKRNPNSDKIAYEYYKKEAEKEYTEEKEKNNVKKLLR